MKKVLITGGAGFIGSNLADNFLKKNYSVIVLDNLSTGKIKFIEHNFNNPDYEFHEVDLKNINAIEKYFDQSIDFVFHFAANADIRDGLKHPKKDLDENTIVTFNILECIRKNKIKNLAFSSTSAVYGDSAVLPIPENAQFPIQTSLYGASKLACEGLIQAYSIGFNIKCFIFRFVSILGPRYTHGHIYDFCEQLFNDPNQLTVLGDGEQIKSYLHVYDCISAINHILNNSNDQINIFNLGVRETWPVKNSAQLVSQELNFDAEILYSGGQRGWIGDNPNLYLDITKLMALGWKNKYSINESVIDTVKYLKNNRWLFNY